ncbi:hypothetical protein ABVT39_006747 [Epinephelus coioides]
MIQLTSTISLFVFSYVFYRINASLCCLIVTLSIFNTLNTPLNLAVMAVECYIAICLPLRHAELCTIKGQEYNPSPWISATVVYANLYSPCIEKGSAELVS